MRSTFQTTSVIALIAGGFSAVPAIAQDNLSSGIEDIVITARKKAETLQTAPISVGALTTESINQLAVRDVSDIAKTISGISFENDFGRQGDRPVIRGQASILGESGVAFFIDGVYTSNSITNINVQEIERIEVVKGPQSALYGRNTYSGAINVITRRPGEELSARFLAEAAQFGDLQFTGFVSGPITDNLGFIASARYYERDGTFTNQFDGDDLGDEESVNFSGGLFFDPNERASFDLRLTYGEDRDGPIPSFLQPTEENNCFQDNGFLYNGANRYFCGNIEARPSDLDYSRQFTQRPGFSRDRFTASLRSEYDFDFATLTHIVGYNENDEVFRSDSDHSASSFETAFFAGFPLGTPPGAPLGLVYGGIADFSFEEASEQQEFSTEIRLASNGDGPLQWLVGGFYLDIDQSTRGIREIPAGAQARADANFDAGLDEVVDKANSRAPFPGFYSAFIPPILLPNPNAFNSANPSEIFVPRNVSDTQTRNLAAFAEVSYDFTDQFTASFEARFASEKFDARRIRQNLGQAPILDVEASDTFNAFTPRFTLDYQVSPDSLIYGIAARGTKPGGLNDAIAISLGAESFFEEDVWSLEFGSKNTWLDGQLRFNVAAFYNMIQDYQLTENVSEGALSTSATINAGDADVYGIEIDGAFSPASLPGLVFTFNGAFTNSEFQNGFDENQETLDELAGCTTNCGDISGKRIPRQARWQLFGDLTYRGNITDEIGYFIGGNISYQSSQFVQVHNEATFGEFALVNFNAGISGDFWELQIFGRNITDEDSPVAVLRYADGSEDFRRAFFGVQRPGSQWGGRVIFKY